MTNAARDVWTALPINSCADEPRPLARCVLLRPLVSKWWMSTSGFGKFRWVVSELDRALQAARDYDRARYGGARPRDQIAADVKRDHYELQSCMRPADDARRA